MTQLNPAGNFYFSNTGALRLAQDNSSVGTVITLPFERVTLSDADNAAYPAVIDASQILHIKALGVVMGALNTSGIVSPDRGLHTFLNTAFGPRNGPINGYILNLLPHTGGTVRKCTGVYINRYGISGQFGTRGDDLIIRHSIGGPVTDPRNVYTAATLTPQSYEGTTGAGQASFANCSFTDGQVSPTTYDGITMFSLGLDNGMIVQPSIKNPTNRIVSGCTPGQLAGSFSLTQLKGATNPIPQTTGVYPFQVLIPTGDGLHTLKLDVSASFDASREGYSPEGFETVTVSFTLFGTSTGATATATHMFVASYA